LGGQAPQSETGENPGPRAGLPGGSIDAGADSQSNAACAAMAWPGGLIHKEAVMLATVHRTTIVGRCPHGCADVYEAEFHVSGRVLIVEAIQEAIDAATAEPIYQEALTQRLADRLDCAVVTRGAHGKFLSECRAEPEGD
jgi:hypothetical protein